MAHIPLIHGADGAKLSKRHGALGVEAYREMGYLPDALRNYLIRLGWAHGDEEFFTEERLLEVFGFGGMGKSPARFDFAKLENMNGHYIRAADDRALLQRLRELLGHVESRHRGTRNAGRPGTRGGPPSTHARPERAREDAARTVGQRTLSLRIAPPRTRAEGRGAARQRRRRGPPRPRPASPIAWRTWTTGRSKPSRPWSERRRRNRI